MFFDIIETDKFRKFKGENILKNIIVFFLIIAILISSCACSNTPDEKTDDATTVDTSVVTDEVTEAESEEATEEVTEQASTDTEPVVEQEVLYDLTYSQGTIAAASGEAGKNVKRLLINETIEIENFKAITLAKGYQLTWLAYGENNVYLGNGSNTYPTMPSGGVWLGEGVGIAAEQILEWNSNTKYVRFVVKRTDGAEIDVEKDAKLCELKVFVSGYVPAKPEANEYQYEGEILGTNNTVSYELVASIGGLQDAAVYGDFLFAFTGEGKCKVYELGKYNRVLSQFELNKISIIKPHSNSACFGSYKYDENDEFPLLYCNVYNNYGKDRTDLYGVCNVYRLKRNGTKFSTELVQVIKVGFTDDTTLWSSPNGDARPYGNFVVDTDRNKLIAFTMRDGDISTRFFEFDLPLPTAGELESTLGVNKVTLTKDDIKDSFKVSYFRYIQGCTYYNGKVYSLEGFTNNKTNYPSLKVVDLEKNKLLAEVKLFDMGLTVEPEAAYVIDDILYYIDVSGNIYKLIFH